MIKPIETHYKGRLFRSRLETRWAVFFDTLGVQWEYEPEGFELGDGLRYLPDFWLPQVNLWAEVKPKPLSASELHRCFLLFKGTGHGVVLLIGTPDFIEYDILEEPLWGETQPYSLVPHSLTTEYLIDEHRFFSQGYPTPGDMGYWGTDYSNAVNAARSARFEYGECGSNLSKPEGPIPYNHPWLTRQPGESKRAYLKRIMD